MRYALCARNTVFCINQLIQFLQNPEKEVLPSASCRRAEHQELCTRPGCVYTMCSCFTHTLYIWTEGHLIGHFGAPVFLLRHSTVIGTIFILGLSCQVSGPVEMFTYELAGEWYCCCCIYHV